jgi:hypothetical protein
MPRILTAILASSLTCFLLAATTNAQNATRLRPGTSLERSLNPGQVHSFSVDVEENNFVQLTVLQRGMDVLIKVLSPDGKDLGLYDSPNGSEGIENVSFVANAAGVYLVKVQSLSPDVAAGRYEIKVLEIRPATEEELKASRNQQNMKVRGLALLREVEEVIPQIKSSRTRISTQLQTSQLFWESDRKRASKLLADAVAGFKEALASTDFSDPEHVVKYQALYQLRLEIIQILAARDPDAALSFLYSTVPTTDPYGNSGNLASQENALELSIVNQIMTNDPKRALQMALRSLKSRYSNDLLGVVFQFQARNPELAAELATEIVNKLLNEKLLQDQEAMNLAVSLAQQARPPDLKSTDGTGTKTAPLSEEQYKSLVQKLINEAMSYSTNPAAPYTTERVSAINMLVGLQSMGAELDKFVAGSKEVIAQKLREMQFVLPQPPTTDYANLSESSVEASLEVIEKAPQEVREQLYIDLASRQVNSGQVALARRIINDRVSNPYQRRQWLTQIEQQEITLAMSKGDIQGALRNVARLRTTGERATQLTQIASQIGLGHKRASALNFLEQARSLLGSSIQAQDGEQMSALLEIARAFSRYDSKRAVEIIDPLIEQFNEMCVAARTLNGFGGAYFDNEELELSDGNPVGNVATQITNVLASIALTDFDRAKASSDKIRLPEIRLRAYIDIAQETVLVKETIKLDYQN